MMTMMMTKITADISQNSAPQRSKVISTIPHPPMTPFPAMLLMIPTAAHLHPLLLPPPPKQQVPNSRKTLTSHPLPLLPHRTLHKGLDMVTLQRQLQFQLQHTTVLLLLRRRHLTRLLCLPPLTAVMGKPLLLPVPSSPTLLLLQLPPPLLRPALSTCGEHPLRLQLPNPW